MSKVILYPDGAYTTMAPGFSAEAERMSLVARGVDCRIVGRAELKDQRERVTAAQIDALAPVRRVRNRRLERLDLQQAFAFAGYHPKGRTAEQVEAEKQRLFDLPATVTSRGNLDRKDAGELEAYLPPELEDG